jgi:uncharacterized protein
MLVHLTNSIGLAERESLVDSRFARSKYLKIIEKTGTRDVFLYHSLFGNLHLVNSECLNIIDFFSKPETIEAAVESLVSFESAHEIIREFLSLYYLVPQGFDERILTQTELSERANNVATGQLVSAIQLNVSEGCNLKCSYCFADRVDERASLVNVRARNDARLMSLETAMASIDAVTELVRRNGMEALVIKFFGREPLLNWRVISQVLEHYGVKDSQFLYKYAITTNGTLLTSEIVEKLKRFNVITVVSLDGFAQSNSLRLTHAGKETFSAVDSALRLLQDGSVSCSVASVLSNHNFASLGHSFLDYLHERSVSACEVKLAMQLDQAGGFSGDDCAEKLFDLYQYGQKIGIAVTGDWYDPFATFFHTTRRPNDRRVHRLAPHSCSATDHQISIEPTGNVYGCRAMEMRLGNIDDLELLLRSPAYQHLAMRTYYNVPYCHGCKLEGFCQGVCLGHSEKRYNDIYRPDAAYCDVYRAVFDLLLKNWSVSNPSSEL